MTDPGNPADLLSATREFVGDAEYGWWRNAHPRGFVLAVRTRPPVLLHRATCDKVDRDRHPGALRAKGSRQICAESPAALRAWLAREAPGAGAVLERCPKCTP